MKYRKRPIEVGAFRFFYRSAKFAFPMWAQEAMDHGVIYSRSGKWMILTMEGEMVVSDGDYIIQGIEGELYPCKPGIFEATYEEVQ